MKTIKLTVLKKTGKQNLYIIPYIFTFLNAFFGFLSIIKTLDNEFIIATYCIILAACMDFFDGRLARAFNSVSCFGMELDSLCDAISFCLAPAILLYNWYLIDIPVYGILVLSFYLCAGLSRLAKFNILAQQGKGKNFFVGLPTTVTAFFVSTFVLGSTWIGHSIFSFLLTDIGLISTIIILALLMISPIKFPSFKTTAPTYRIRLYFYSIAFFTTCLLFFYAYNGYPSFFLMILFYIVCGPIYQKYMTPNN